MNDHNPGTSQQAAAYRKDDPDFARWAEGHGVIQHRDETQVCIYQLVQSLNARGATGDAVGLYDLLIALDRLISAALWLVVHQTYARTVYLDGRPLDTEDFKVRPDGHTGGRSTWCRPMPVISPPMRRPAAPEAG